MKLIALVPLLGALVMQSGTPAPGSVRIWTVERHPVDRGRRSRRSSTPSSTPASRRAPTATARSRSPIARARGRRRSTTRWPTSWSSRKARSPSSTAARSSTARPPRRARRAGPAITGGTEVEPRPRRHHAHPRQDPAPVQARARRQADLLRGESRTVGSARAPHLAARTSWRRLEHATWQIQPGPRPAAVLTTTVAAQKTTPMGTGGGGSPHEKTEWTIDGAKLSIEYGRPVLKGRPEAQLMPAGQPWRTGADVATILTTDKPLKFGTLSVPAGQLHHQHPAGRRVAADPRQAR